MGRRGRGKGKERYKEYMGRGWRGKWKEGREVTAGEIRKEGGEGDG